MDDPENFQNYPKSNKKTEDVLERIEREHFKAK